MKRSSIKGFTLAEVLVTLTIIGVIAALTIPSLLQNINDAQYHTAWKKTFSDLSQATSKLKMDNGGTLAGVFQNTSDMVNKYAPYFSYLKTCPNGNANCWHNANEWYNQDGTSKILGNGIGIILGNGDLLSFQYNSQDCTDNSPGSKFSDCGYIFVDINGFKGPNTVGTDIFYTWITANGLSPFGYNDYAKNTCGVAGNSGSGCSAQYLMQ